MKNIDLKANKRFTTVLAMILATCVVIGLLSSTAIKLASATMLLKNSKLKEIPIIGEFLDDVVDQPAQPTPSPAPSTPSNSGSSNTPATTKPTEAPTTQAPATTKPAETEKEETKAPETQAPETQAPETQAPETEAGLTVAEKQAILKNYKDVIGRAKLKNAQPSFTKATYRSIDQGLITGWFFGDAIDRNADYFVSEADAKASPLVVPAKTVSDALCIENKNSACLLNANDAELVDKAIKNATKETLADGTVKIVIVLNDEVNPKPVVAGKAPQSFTSTMFPVLTGEQVRIAMDVNGVEKVDLTYTNCTVELIYKPATGEIVSLKQTTNYVADATDGYIKGTLTAGTITEVSEYYNFVY
ncbi:MAG: hypothetical protein J6A49_10110 [Clostridia bacterium]|nr:hypothetical protein [Clostridia bacterium]